jgi:predicted metal-dependent peptidase
MTHPTNAPSPRTAQDLTMLGADAKPERFTEAMSKLIMQHPFYAVVLMDALKVQFTDSVETMATDGTNIFVNPAFAQSLTVDENLFVICHEVLHYILQHIPRGKLYQDRGLGPDLKEYSHDKMNQAADYIINDILVRGKVGTMPKIGLHDVSIANFDDIADEVYGKLPDPPKQPPGGGGGNGSGKGGGQGQGHGNFDEHLNPSANQPQPTPADVQRTTAQARNAAKAQGKMPADLERLVDDILDPQQDWKELLADEMTNAIGKDEATWARPNRRRLCGNPSVYMPGTTGHAAGHVVVQVDTSGSIGAKELQTFFSEIVGILTDARPESCTVLWTDSRVAGVDEVEYPEQILDLKAKGGGGTDMTAGITWCEKNGIAPSVFVCLTDGYTPWPTKEPDFKTIWVITEEGQESPVGTNVYIKMEPS